MRGRPNTFLIMHSQSDWESAQISDDRSEWQDLMCRSLPTKHEGMLRVRLWNWTTSNMMFQCTNWVALVRLRICWFLRFTLCDRPNRTTGIHPMYKLNLGLDSEYRARYKFGQTMRLKAGKLTDVAPTIWSDTQGVYVLGCLAALTVKLCYVGSWTLWIRLKPRCMLNSYIFSGYTSRYHCSENCRHLVQWECYPNGFREPCPNWKKRRFQSLALRLTSPSQSTRW